MIGKPVPPYTSPGDYIINLMHAKEKPDAAEIKVQNEMYNAYDTHTRKGVRDQMRSDMERAPEIGSSALKQMRGSSFALQCKLLFFRAFMNLFRNKQLFQARIVQTVVIAIVVDILFFRRTGYGMQDVRDKNSAIYLMSVIQLMNTIQSVVLSCMLHGHHTL